MRRSSLSRLSVIVLGLALSAGVVRLTGQAPPPEMKPFVLMDVGPLPAPEVCGCVTKPFTVMPLRPGWGYGSGLAAPDADAPPSTLERRLQAQRDAGDRAALIAMVDDAFSGNGHASIAVAFLFASGTAVKHDDTQAAEWFLLAARQGHPDAYAPVGYRYLHGLGVPQDDQAAAHWFRVGAAKGQKMAMVALGGLYAAGRGVQQDWTTAVAWWTSAEYWRFVGDAYACGVGVARDDELAARAYQSGVDRGDAGSTIQLAQMYASGCATPPAADAAYRAYKRAADEGYPEAQIGLSRLFLDGSGVAPSPYEAYFWARLAELRVPAGEQRSRARALADLAARYMSRAEVNDADTFVKGVIASGAEPMNR